MVRWFFRGFLWGSQGCYFFLSRDDRNDERVEVGAGDWFAGPSGRMLGTPEGLEDEVSWGGAIRMLQYFFGSFRDQVSFRGLAEGMCLALTPASLRQVGRGLKTYSIGTTAMIFKRRAVETVETAFPLLSDWEA